MRPKYPNYIDLRITDDLLAEIKKSLGLRYTIGDLSSNSDTDAMLLEIVNFCDNNESGPIFLKSIKEANEDKIL